MLAMIRVLKLFIVLMFMVPLCYSFQPKVTKDSFGADQTESERREQNFYFPLDFLLIKEARQPTTVLRKYF
jgi:hypothetical protein